MIVLLTLPSALAATITVGTDAADLASALKAAGPDDIIALPAGTWSGCATASGVVTIEGMGPSRTILESSGCPDGLSHSGGELNITGVTLRNPGGRALKVEGGSVNLLDVAITDSGAERLTGGGLYLGNTTATITNSRFAGNTADRGGALHVEGGSLTAVGVKLEGNQAQFGGALSARNRSRISLSICQFQGNTAAFKGYGKGGAVYGFSGVTLEDIGSTFAGNASAVYGGAILLERDGGTLKLDGTTLRDNHIIDDAITESSGGAIFADAISSVVLTEILATGNRAYLYGGFAYLGRLQQGATITDSVFSDNAVVSKRGGAIEAMEGGELRIIGGKFTGNTAPEGGGAISLYNNSGRFVGVHIAGNFNTSTRDAFGGGVFAFSTREHTLTLEDSVVEYNTAALSGGGVYASGLSALRVVGTIFSGNTASAIDNDGRYFGGGINAHDIPSVALSATRFCNNTADDGSSLYLEAVESTSIVRSTFGPHVAGERGGDGAVKAAGVSADAAVIWTENGVDGCE